MIDLSEVIHPCGCVYRDHDATARKGGLRVCVKRCAEHEALSVVPRERELPVGDVRKGGESK